jgi:hypothetical protein
MKLTIKQKFYHLIQKQFIVLITLLISGSVSHEISNLNLKHEIIKQHSGENLLNLSRQEINELIRIITPSFFHNNTSFNHVIKNYTDLKPEEKFIICLNRINKYPRWSKSTFS